MGKLTLADNHFVTSVIRAARIELDTKFTTKKSNKQEKVQTDKETCSNALTVLRDAFIQLILDTSAVDQAALAELDTDKKRNHPCSMLFKQFATKFADGKLELPNTLFYAKNQTKISIDYKKPNWLEGNAFTLSFPKKGTDLHGPWLKFLHTLITKITFDKGQNQIIANWLVSQGFVFSEAKDVDQAASQILTEPIATKKLRPAKMQPLSLSPIAETPLKPATTPEKKEPQTPSPLLRNESLVRVFPTSADPESPPPLNRRSPGSADSTQRSHQVTPPQFDPDNEFHFDREPNAFLFEDIEPEPPTPFTVQNLIETDGDLPSRPMPEISPLMAALSDPQKESYRSPVNVPTQGSHSPSYVETGSKDPQDDPRDRDASTKRRRKLFDDKDFNDESPFKFSQLAPFEIPGLDPLKFSAFTQATTTATAFTNSSTPPAIQAKSFKPILKLTLQESKTLPINEKLSRLEVKLNRMLQENKSLTSDPEQAAYFSSKNIELRVLAKFRAYCEELREIDEDHENFNELHLLKHYVFHWINEDSGSKNAKYFMPNFCQTLSARSCFNKILLCLLGLFVVALLAYATLTLIAHTDPGLLTRTFDALQMTGSTVANAITDAATHIADSELLTAGGATSGVLATAIIASLTIFKCSTKPTLANAANCAKELTTVPSYGK